MFPEDQAGELRGHDHFAEPLIDVAKLDAASPPPCGLCRTAPIGLR
jgi:hypothetical protein